MPKHKNTATDSGLTAQQNLFCHEYLKDLNATQAAIRAGYSENTARQQGARLLSNVDIQNQIQAVSNERLEKINVTTESIIEDIVEIKNRCMQKEPVMEYDPIEKKMVHSGEWKFKEQGALKACELLGKYRSIFTEKIELSGDKENPIQINQVDLSERVSSLKGE